MADKTRNYDEELARIMNGLAESTLGASDEELDEELAEEGDDPKLVANEIRSVLRRAIKTHRQRNLLEARKTYEERVSQLEKKKYSLPDSAEEQRSLLMSLLAGSPNVRSLLTAQNRDFSHLPDSEVTSYLIQLRELGALDDSAGEKRSEGES
jgi:hypothetical protein